MITLVVSPLFIPFIYLQTDIVAAFYYLAQCMPFIMDDHGHHYPAFNFRPSNY